MKRNRLGKNWTAHVEEQWQEYYKARQNWCDQKPESFLASLAPVNEFARFLDKHAEQIVEKTPYKNWHPTGVHPGVNFISLGVWDNFECVLEVDDKARTFVAAFRATLDIGFNYHHRTSMSRDPVKLINEGLNEAKMGIKAEIENRTKAMIPYMRMATTTEGKVSSTIETGDE